jgi:hypothetical protein
LHDEANNRRRREACPAHAHSWVVGGVSRLLATGAIRP